MSGGRSLGCAVAVAVAVAAPSACVGDPYPGPLRQLEMDSDTFCTDVNASVARYRIEVEVGGAADGIGTNGAVRLRLEKDRAFDDERLVVTIRCGDSEDIKMPTPEDSASAAVGHVHFDETVPLEMTCELTLENPSVSDGSECLPWFIHVDAGLDTREAPDAFVEVEVTEVEVKE